MLCLFTVLVLMSALLSATTLPTVWSVVASTINRASDACRTPLPQELLRTPIVRMPAPIALMESPSCKTKVSVDSWLFTKFCGGGGKLPNYCWKTDLFCRYWNPGYRIDFLAVVPKRSPIQHQQFLLVQLGRASHQKKFRHRFRWESDETRDNDQWSNHGLHGCLQWFLQL